MTAETGTYDKAFERLAFYIQLVYVNNSWDIFTKLYIMERLFANAIKDDATWTANKDNLGFSTYTLADADAIDGNDFMYVALSYISDMDHADYFEAWGVAVSDAAKAQVTGNTPSGSIPKVFYYVEGNKVFSTLPSADNANERALDGVTAY
ncbi:MAG: hypothetical protein GY866_41150 [Proteobacteria bacterium]|nr:hypothetical protein [Pseudomonadota bacterium]